MSSNSSGGRRARSLPLAITTPPASANRSGGRAVSAKKSGRNQQGGPYPATKRAKAKHVHLTSQQGDDDIDPEGALQSLPRVLAESLLPFQREGVQFAIRNCGRVLIGDEMGLGKTVQAIATAWVFRHEWPLLIIVPSSVKGSWIDELEKWLPTLQPMDFNVVRSGTDVAHLDRRITLVTYGLLQQAVLAARIAEAGFKVIIVDESHYVKNRKAKRSKVIVPLLQQSRRCLLLSGTPALSRPEELYCQLDALCAGHFGSFTAYARRYCNAKMGRFGWDTKGASNLDELHARLRSGIMIRRLKKDVLSQLPPKRRQRVTVEVTNKKLCKLLEAGFNELKRLDSDPNTQQFESHRLLQSLFHDTSTAKMDSVKEYIKGMCDAGGKFLVFAYHLNMLKALEEAVASQGVEYIMIVGETPVHERHDMVKKFQASNRCRVAILSLLAASQGITLTAASTVVFAELHWTPGIIEQAEDRAHRIGQTDTSVNIHYLVAPNTLDDILWSTLSRKVGVVSTTLNGERSRLVANKSRADKSLADAARKHSSQEMDTDEIEDDDDDDDEDSGFRRTSSTRGDGGGDDDGGGGADASQEGSGLAAAWTSSSAYLMASAGTAPITQKNDLRLFFSPTRAAATHDPPLSSSSTSPSTTSSTSTTATTPAANATPGAMWACTACTYRNAPSAKKRCSMCGSARPRQRTRNSSHSSDARESSAARLSPVSSPPSSPGANEAQRPSNGTSGVKRNKNGRGDGHDGGVDGDDVSPFSPAAFVQLQRRSRNTNNVNIGSSTATHITTGATASSSTIGSGTNRSTAVDAANMRGGSVAPSPSNPPGMSRFQFCMSAHTGRVWLYNREGKPLHVNFHPQDFVHGNMDALPAMVKSPHAQPEIAYFLREYRSLRPIQQKTIANIVMPDVKTGLERARAMMSGSTTSGGSISTLVRSKSAGSGGSGGAVTPGGSTTRFTSPTAFGSAPEQARRKRSTKPATPTLHQFCTPVKRSDKAGRRSTDALTSSTRAHSAAQEVPVKQQSRHASAAVGLNASVLLDDESDDEDDADGVEGQGGTIEVETGAVPVVTAGKARRRTHRAARTPTRSQATAPATPAAAIDAFSPVILLGDNDDKDDGGVDVGIGGDGDAGDDDVQYSRERSPDLVLCSSDEEDADDDDDNTVRGMRNTHPRTTGRTANTRTSALVSSAPAVAHQRDVRWLNSDSEGEDDQHAAHDDVGDIGDDVGEGDEGDAGDEGSEHAQNANPNQSQAPGPSTTSPVTPRLSRARDVGLGCAFDALTPSKHEQRRAKSTAVSKRTTKAAARRTAKPASGDGDDQPRTIECRFCKTPIPQQQDSTLEQRFCSHECWEQFSVQTGSGGAVRRRLLELEGGVCQLCRVDAHALYKHVRALASPQARKAVLSSTAFNTLSTAKLKLIIANPKEGQFWQADHIIPVCEGGGECDLSNYRTLCTPCHDKETKKLAKNRSQRALREAAKTSKDIRGFFSPPPK